MILRKKSKINSNNSRIYDLVARYLILLMLGLGNLFIFYFFFTPLTIYPVYYTLDILYNIQVFGINLVIGDYIISLVEACIAGAAYYLLTILNLSTQMEIKKRFYSLFYCFAIFLILNIMRIVFLSILFVESSALFDITHKLLWYGLSTVFVVLIWFSAVWIFSIKNIPIYSDFKYLIKIIL